MQSACITTSSDEFRTTRWLGAQGDVTAALRCAAASSPRSFLVSGQIYALRIRSAHAPNAFEFTWVPRKCGLVPPLSGTATVRRLGPIAAVTLQGSYYVASDAAGSLASVAVGRDMGRQALKHASRAIAFTVSHGQGHGA